MIVTGSINELGAALKSGGEGVSYRKIDDEIAYSSKTVESIWG
jgi:hypothetical protein